MTTQVDPAISVQSKTLASGISAPAGTVGSLEALLLQLPLQVSNLNSAHNP